MLTFAGAQGSAGNATSLHASRISAGATSASTWAISLAALFLLPSFLWFSIGRRRVGRPFYLELRLQRISPAGGGVPTEGGRRARDGFIISKEQVGA